MNQKVLFFSLALLLSLASFIPMLGQRRESEQVPYTDIVLAIDESGSMNSNDPSNVRRYGMEILTRLLIESHRKNLRIIPFTHCIGNCGNGQMQKLLAQNQVQNLWQNWQTIPDGTDIPLAIQECMRTLKSSVSQRKVIIILSDGDTNNMNNVMNDAGSLHQNQHFYKHISLCKEEHIQIYTIIINPASVVPGKTSAMPSQMLDPSLKKASLFMKVIANETGGKCYELTAEQGFSEIFYSIFGQIDPGIWIPQLTAAQFDVQIGFHTVIISASSKVGKIRLPSGKEVGLPVNAKQYGMDMESYNAGEKNIAIFHRPENESDFTHWTGLWRFLQRDGSPVSIGDISIAVFFDFVLIPGQEFVAYYQYESPRLAFKVKNLSDRVDESIKRLLDTANCSVAVADTNSIPDMFFPAEQKANGAYEIEYPTLESSGRKICYARLESIYKGQTVLLGKTHFPFSIYPLDIGPVKVYVKSGQIYQEKEVTAGDSVRIFLATRLTFEDVQAKCDGLGVETIRQENDKVGRTSIPGYTVYGRIDQNAKKISVILSMNYKTADTNALHRLQFSAVSGLPVGQRLLNITMSWPTDSLECFVNEVLNLNLNVSAMGGSSESRDDASNASLVCKLQNPASEEEIVLKKVAEKKSDGNELSWTSENNVPIKSAENQTITFVGFQKRPASAALIQRPRTLSLIVHDVLLWSCFDQDSPNALNNLNSRLDINQRWVFHAESKEPDRAQISDGSFEMEYEQTKTRIRNLRLTSDGGVWKTDPVQFPEVGKVKVTATLNIRTSSGQRKCKFYLGSLYVIKNELLLKVVWQKFPKTFYAGCTPKIPYKVMVEGGDPKSRINLERRLASGPLNNFEALVNQNDSLHRHIPDDDGLSGNVQFKHIASYGTLTANCKDERMGDAIVESFPFEAKIFPFKIRILQDHPKPAKVYAGEKLVILFHLEGESEEGITLFPETSSWWMKQIAASVLQAKTDNLFIVRIEEREIPCAIQLDDQGKGKLEFSPDTDGLVTIELNKTFCDGHPGCIFGNNIAAIGTVGRNTVWLVLALFFLCLSAFFMFLISFVEKSFWNLFRKSLVPLNYQIKIKSLNNNTEFSWIPVPWWSKFFHGMDKLYTGWYTTGDMMGKAIPAFLSSHKYYRIRKMSMPLPVLILFWGILAVGSSCIMLLRAYHGELDGSMLLNSGIVWSILPFVFNVLCVVTYSNCYAVEIVIDDHTKIQLWIRVEKGINATTGEKDIFLLGKWNPLETFVPTPVQSVVYQNLPGGWTILMNKWYEQNILTYSVRKEYVQISWNKAVVESLCSRK